MLPLLIGIAKIGAFLFWQNFFSVSDLSSPKYSEPCRQTKLYIKYSFYLIEKICENKVNKKLCAALPGFQSLPSPQFKKIPAHEYERFYPFQTNRIL